MPQVTVKSILGKRIGRLLSYQVAPYANKNKNLANISVDAGRLLAPWSCRTTGSSKKKTVLKILLDNIP
jgi:hypothetical protein